MFILLIIIAILLGTGISEAAHNRATSEEASVLTILRQKDGPGKVAGELISLRRFKEETEERDRLNSIEAETLVQRVQNLSSTTTAQNKIADELFEQLNTTITNQNRTIEQKDATIEQKDATIVEKNQTITSLNDKNTNLETKLRKQSYVLYGISFGAIAGTFWGIQKYGMPQLPSMPTFSMPSFSMSSVRFPSLPSSMSSLSSLISSRLQF